MWYSVFFYSIYKFIKRFDKRVAYPDYVHWITSVLFVSAHMGINLMVIQFLLEQFVAIDFGRVSKFYFYPILVINFAYFFKGKNYKTISEKLDLWSRRKKLGAYFATVFYLVITLGTFILITI